MKSLRINLRPLRVTCMMSITVISVMKLTPVPFISFSATSICIIRIHPFPISIGILYHTRKECCADG